MTNRPLKGRVMWFSLFTVASPGPGIVRDEQQAPHACWLSYIQSKPNLGHDGVTAQWCRLARIQGKVKDGNSVAV